MPRIGATEIYLNGKTIHVFMITNPCDDPDTANAIRTLEQQLDTTEDYDSDIERALGVLDAYPDW